MQIAGNTAKPDSEPKPWVKNYDPGVPATLRPYPDATLLDVLADTVKQRPKHPILIFNGARMSAATVERLSTDLAAGMAELGIEKHDRVALLLPNCPQAIVGHFAIWKAGGVAVPINPFYTSAELERQLSECGAKLAVVLSPFYRKVKMVQARLGVRTIIATSIKEYLPHVPRLLFTLAREKKEGYAADLQAGDVWLQSLLRRHARSVRPDAGIGPDDPAILLFSGGTTGDPKGAIGSHRSLAMSGAQLHTWFGTVLNDWDDVIMQVLPHFHVYGNIGVMATALTGRNPLALVPDPRNMNDVIKTIHTAQPAFLPSVPTFFNALINHPDVKAGNIDFKSLKLCISGGSPLPDETRKRFERLTGRRLIEGYGLTESMMAAIVNPAKGGGKPGSIGLPLPDVEARIAATGNSESLRPGEHGELLLRAPRQVMLEYCGRRAETSDVIRDGWLHTGDIGYMDEDGYVFIAGRKKDLIKAGGFQVWPDEIEDVVAAIPGIAEVSAAGIPDPYRGETVKIWVVLQPGRRVTEEEILSECREKLAAYKVPRQIEFRESLPRTAAGKVLRRRLVEEHVAGSQEAERKR